jgi:cysteine-rich repeat protein
MIAWQSAQLDGPTRTHLIRTMKAAIAGSRCGDGNAAARGEACDDEKLTDGDGSDSDCSVTGCGNWIVTEGEECDVGDNGEALRLFGLSQSGVR